MTLENPQAVAGERRAQDAVDHRYECGCYWYCGNIVACAKHSPYRHAAASRAGGARELQELRREMRELMAVIAQLELRIADGCEQADASNGGPNLRKWLPIETAPKDGTTWVLLGWFELLEESTPAVGFWHSGERAWCDTHQVLHNQQFHPSHWMPLPDPPVLSSPGAAELEKKEL